MNEVGDAALLRGAWAEARAAFESSLVDEETAHAYERLSGHVPEDLAWYEALAGLVATSLDMDKVFSIVERQ